MRVNAHPNDSLRKNSHRLSQVTGLDLDCGAYYPDSLQNAVMQGEVAETEIDDQRRVVLLKNGVPCRYATPLDDISSYGEVIYEMGCGEMACWNDSLIFPATEAAKKAGVTMLLMEGGQGIAGVVFGKYNPGGRLPLAWYESSYVDMLPMTSMPLRPVDSFGYPGRKYKFYNGSIVYPFGYGLSCMEFKNELASPAEASLYTSEGDKDGSEVVLVCSKPPDGISGTHAKQVIGFERVFVAAGKSNKVRFSLNACKSLSIVDTTGYKVLPSGVHKITVGDGDLLFFCEIELQPLASSHAHVFADRLPNMSSIPRYMVYEYTASTRANHKI
ncbi:beta-D-xylosidase [Salix suchowensis]|nr:beta-D-xylosidase [Salix suchowensis]